MEIGGSMATGDDGEKQGYVLLKMRQSNNVTLHKFSDTKYSMRVYKASILQLIW